jgi:hypothetical protein
MKKHSGMRPLDVVVLLKIAILNKGSWFAKDISRSLDISAGEISESLNRSAIAGLLSSDKKKLMKHAFLEFLIYGLKYVFPQSPGALVKGIATAHSAPPLNKIINSGDNFVWPYPSGNLRGQAVDPLYKTVPEVSQRDIKLYEILALTDALRIGKVREQKIAAEEIKKRIINDNQGI